jgi:hypothetical protein
LEENNTFCTVGLFVHVRLDFLMLYGYCCVYLTVDPETHTHQIGFDLKSLTFIGKPKLYNTEHDKKFTFSLLSFIFHRRAVVKQDHHKTRL